MAAAAVLAGLVGSARGQLVIGSEAAGGNITLIDLTGASVPRVLASGVTAQAIAADDAGQMLYWVTSSPRALYKAAYTPSGELVATQIGGSLSAANTPTGLAWDSAAGQLIGFYSASSPGDSTLSDGVVRSIDTTTGATTVLSTVSGMAFIGADYDSATDTFLGTTTANTSFPSQVRSLVRLTKPLGTPTAAVLTEYPDTGYLGFKGVAVGNGRVFMLGGVVGNNSPAPVTVNHVYNLATGVYEPAPGISDASLSGATWAPGLLTPAAGTNLMMSGGASDACAAAMGGKIVYSARIDNIGADASGPVTLTVNLPPSSQATFSGSTPAPTGVTASQLTYELAPIAGYAAGGNANVRIELDALSAGAFVTVTMNASTTSDTDNGNNSAQVTARVRPSAPTNAVIRGVLSTKPSLANSLLPGGGGERFKDFANLVGSPDGSRWLLTGFVSPSATTNDMVYVRGSTAGSPETLLRENTTPWSGPGGTVGNINDQADIANNGRVAFDSDDAGPTASDKYVATTLDGVTFTEIAREGQTIPAIPDSTYGAAMARVHIFENGQVGFVGQASPGNNGVMLRNNGAELLLRQNVTVPVGAEGPAIAVGTGDTALNNTAYDATGGHWATFTAIGGLPTSSDRCLIVNGERVYQENVTEYLPGYLSSPFENDVRMGPEGMWMAIDRTFTYYREDFIVRGFGTQMLQFFKTNDPIHIGATETWSDVGPTTTTFSPADTFFTFNPGPNGHYVIGGYTDVMDDYADSVLVLDNLVVIARENDPVDLNGNGVFDDDAYIRSFVRLESVGQFQGQIVFTDDHAVLAMVALRDAESALCQVTDIQQHWALVKIPLPVTGACCNGSTCTMVLSAAACAAGVYQGDRSACLPTTCAVASENCCRGTTCNSIAVGTCTGTVAGSASITVASCGSGAGLSSCCYADFNHDGTQSIDDLFLYFNAYFTGSPWANYGGDGVETPTIDDLFLYINAYFTGCV